MSPERIKQLLDTKPFAPFTIHTGDGSSVDVLSREFAWLRPGNRTLIVSVPMSEHAKDEGEFRDHNIDVFLITKVTVPPKRRSRNGRKRGG
ncbi:MAG TPA: hypothetical protein VHX86_05055 [Tepidisphaeraceae bacterium]|jgi:hypothetical protein|nr:hypothetical protein [Tepidisphaeraceae bacterium]